MGKQTKIRIVRLFAAHSTSYFLNLAHEQKSLATPGICQGGNFEMSETFVSN